jgi:hypothetical protein
MSNKQGANGMTQTLTPAQRTFIVKAIEHDINDAQVSDYYDFGDMHITWVPARESYLVEQHGEQHWARPKDIWGHIDDLTDEQLIEWFQEEHRGEADTFEECLEDQMSEATAQ